MSLFSYRHQINLSPTPGSGLAREHGVDLGARLGQLAAPFAAASHATRVIDQREAAAHVVAVVRAEVGQHAPAVFLDEGAFLLAIPVAPVGARIGAAPAVPER